VIEKGGSTFSKLHLNEGDGRQDASVLEALGVKKGKSISVDTFVPSWAKRLGAGKKRFSFPKGNFQLY